MRNKLLLVSALLCLSAPTANAGGLTAKSLEALKKYCIPDPKIPNDDGTPVCQSDFMGQYNFKTHRCDCLHPTLLQWDEAIRRCKIKCPSGTRPEILSQEEIIQETGCPRGYKVDAQIN